MPRKETKQTSFRLSVEAHQLLEEIAKKLGITQTAVLEILLREKAKEILRQ
jgi:predicted DNA-binding protein